VLTLANRLKRVNPSATFAISSRATQLKREGKNVINLSVGEPDFDTPLYIKAAGIEAIHNGYSKYTAVNGMLKLREAVCRRLARKNHLSYEASEVIISTGAKQSIFNAFFALLNPSDEVLVPAPCWMSYLEMLNLVEANYKIIPCESKNQYLMTAEQLEASITPKTRMLILNSPNNPSGMAYSKEQYAQIGEVLLKHPNIAILSDDIYEEIIWHPEGFSNILMVCPELKDRTILVNGVSKSHAMTGWRIGYAAASKHIIKAMSTLQSQITACPNSIAQMAATEALDNWKSNKQDMNETFKKRYDMMRDFLNKVPGISIADTHGTFYALPDLTHAIKRCQFKDDVELATAFLEEAHVATVPGSLFHAPNHIRLSCAADTKSIQQALERLEAFLNERSKG
jgi:aspartate aminotransferase